MEFELPAGKVLHLYQLATLFQSMNRILAGLAVIGRESNAPIFSYADVDVVSLEMRSPLKILLAVARLPKSALRAFSFICERVLYYEEERDRRAALAASEWEEVYAKRLRNIKEAIEIASSGQALKGEIYEGQMDRLVEDVIKFERADFRLKKFELEQGS
jgi:hypothetical protein